MLDSAVALAPPNAAGDLGRPLDYRATSPPSAAHLFVRVAGVLFAAVVLPSSTSDLNSGMRPSVFHFKTYADYPFGVLVNDQVDRFSAPIEHRNERRPIEQMLAAAGLMHPSVRARHRCVAQGIRSE